MSISIKTVIRKDKINNNNCAPINIRFTLNRQIRYISTGVAIPLYVWDIETQQINPNYPNAAELQQQITAKRIEYMARWLRAENEVIIEDLGCQWWGRTTSGQAIFLDGVISDIVKGFNLN